MNGRTLALDGRVLTSAAASRGGVCCALHDGWRVSPPPTFRKDALVENGSVESVSLGDYVGVVWRRKWIVIIVTLLVGGAAAIYAKHQQTLYSSTSTGVFSAPSANQHELRSPRSQRPPPVGTFGTDNVELASTPGFDQFALLRIHSTRTLARAVRSAGPDHRSAPTAFREWDPVHGQRPSRRRWRSDLAAALAQPVPGYVPGRTRRRSSPTSRTRSRTTSSRSRDPRSYGLYLKPPPTATSSCSTPKVDTGADRERCRAQIEILSQTRTSPRLKLHRRPTPSTAELVTATAA